MLSVSSCNGTSRAVREALERVHKALLAHPELSPFGPIPLSNGKLTIGESGVVGEPQEEHAKVGETAEAESAKRKRKRRRKGRPTAELLTPNAVVRRIKIGGTGVICCLDHFGPDGPESFSEDNVIYINRDHPLYKAELRKRDAHVLNLARLITQEISLMKNMRSPRKAFEEQSVLLRDAFAN